MPEVIVGLSLLLMLVSVQRMFGFPERGMLTIWIGHFIGDGLCHGSGCVAFARNESSA